MRKIKDAVAEWLKVVLRTIHNIILRRKLQNSDFSIISNNCVGGCVLHDLKQKFNSPTVNVAIPFPDYIKFLSDIKHFIYADFEDVTGDGKGIDTLLHVPKGLLGGEIVVYFVHYKSFEEGVAAWKRRTARINWDNLYVVLVERDGCTLSDVKAFDAMSFKHKVALVHKKYEGVESGFLISGYEDNNEVGNITIYTHRGYHREYDKFPWIKFLNTKDE